VFACESDNAVPNGFVALVVHGWITGEIFEERFEIVE